MKSVKRNSCKPPLFTCRMRNNQLQHYWWVLDMALVTWLTWKIISPPFWPSSVGLPRSSSTEKAKEWLVWRYQSTRQRYYNTVSTDTHYSHIWWWDTPFCSRETMHFACYLSRNCSFHFNFIYDKSMITKPFKCFIHYFLSAHYKMSRQCSLPAP